ncbi:MAG: SDR family NAD(P)-dependent oxidoreductase [Alphaproteobacteria bacterium]|nr:SDR family NAD(P)-dependent oxidoreductase [Alphaproteobacteria bacterium]
MSFKNKHILITGAGRGLGAAFAVVLADLGANLILTARNTQNVKALAESIRLRTGNAPATFKLDLADAGDVTQLAKKLRDENRPLDILINNAATWLPGAMTEHDAYAISTTIAANVTGTLLLTRGLLPLLEATNAGDILNIVSVSGMVNAPLQGASVAYIASKHGQTGMTDALRQELRGRPVRVNALYPTFIKDISPLNAAEWNAVPGPDSWITNRDVVEAGIFALTRPRHLTVANMVLESDTGNFHTH